MHERFPEVVWALPARYWAYIVIVEAYQHLNCCAVNSQVTSELNFHCVCNLHTQ